MNPVNAEIAKLSVNSLGITKIRSANLWADTASSSEPELPRDGAS